MTDVSIPVVTVTGTGANLLDLCRRVADTVGFRLSTTTSEEASFGDAARVVLADELRDDESGDELVARDWLYVSSGAQAQTQRRILNQTGVGYQGHEGALVLSRPFATTLDEGVTIDVTSPLPMRRHLGVQGYREAINQGLGLIWIPARISVTGNGTHEYDLAAHPYLKTIEQTGGIWDTRTNGSTYPEQLSSVPYRIVSNGVARTLITSSLYTTSETFELAVIVRADRLVYDGSSWGYIPSGPTGLQSDTHQTAAPGDWAYAFGCWKAYQHLYKLTMADRSLSDAERQLKLADLMAKRRQWAGACRSIQEYEFPRPFVPPSSPVVAGVGSWGVVQQPGRDVPLVS